MSRYGWSDWRCAKKDGVSDAHLKRHIEAAGDFVQDLTLEFSVSACGLNDWCGPVGISTHFGGDVWVANYNEENTATHLTAANTFGQIR